MITVKSLKRWRTLRAGGRFGGRSLGFVPTMGALHDGHLSLIARARRENDIVAASVFVNPAQFNDKKDLARYPRTLAADTKMLAAAGADFLLAPNAGDMYPDGYRYRVDEKEESRLLCGAYRPGHFEGVLTVVLKLLNLVKPDRAYFGEKDYQQYRLIKGMAEALFLDVEIVPCPIVREPDGLAMSSRNLLLNEEERAIAPALNMVLGSKASIPNMKKALAKLGFGPEYIEERWGRRLAAAKLGKVRLIDNVEA